MASDTEVDSGSITGTADKDDNIIWFTEASLQNVLRLATFIDDAEREGGDELAQFLRRAQAASRRGAEGQAAARREALAAQHPVSDE
jgi:hypothetical protein